MQQIKIAFLIPTLSVGGGEKLTVDLAESLSSYFNVSILLLIDNVRLKVSDKVNLHLFPSKNIVKKILNLNSFIEKNNFNIVISVMEQANFINALLSKINTKFIPVYSVHTPLSQAFIYRSKLKRIVSNFTYKRLLSKNTNIITVSEGIKLELERDFSFTNVKRIYNPINLNKVKELAKERIPMTKKSGVTFISVGRLVCIKGHVDLILAFKLFKDTCSNSRLLIIGSGELYEELNKLILVNSLEDSVYLLGEVINPFPYFLISDLYVCSSKFEGFGLTILESMASKLLVASIDCDYGPREILRSNSNLYGFLSGPVLTGTRNESQQLLLKVMKDGINNSELRQEYLHKLDERVNVFSSEKIVQEYVEYINSVV
jgi:glycosyltransferase involved in cell wall biosynthesis